MTFILGLNAFHGDPAACLLRDGLMVAAGCRRALSAHQALGGFSHRGDVAIHDPGNSLPLPRVGEGWGEGAVRHAPGRPFTMDHAFWGPHFSNEVIAQLLSDRSPEITAEGRTVERIDDEARLFTQTAATLTPTLSRVRERE